MEVFTTATIGLDGLSVERNDRAARVAIAIRQPEVRDGLRVCAMPKPPDTDADASLPSAQSRTDR